MIREGLNKPLAIRQCSIILICQLLNYDIFTYIFAVILNNPGRFFPKDSFTEAFSINSCMFRKFEQNVSIARILRNNTLEINII